jgi:hypothetical protein
MNFASRFVQMIKHKVAECTVIDKFIVATLAFDAVWFSSLSSELNIINHTTIKVKILHRHFIKTVLLSWILKIIYFDHLHISETMWVN